MRRFLLRVGRGLIELLVLSFRSVIRTGRWLMRHPKVAIGLLVGLLLIGAEVWHLSAVTVASAKAEERAFWVKARALSLDDRTEIRNHMVRTGRVPHLLPWWEMDADRCSAVAWKFVNLLSGVELTHGDNGAAWMLRRQNPTKLHTLWDGTSRFDRDGRLGDKLQPTVTEFRALLENLNPDGLYVMGFRWTKTEAAGKIRRDHNDLNSHVVVMAKSMMFHMFRYGKNTDPILADFQERFFDSEEMQPVWLTEVTSRDGKPFRFSATTRELRLEQNIFPWKKLRLVLRIPDWVFGVNAMERTLLYWFRDGYDMYPRLP